MGGGDSGCGSELLGRVSYEGGGGGGHWDFPHPLKFENYDVIIASTATIGYTTQ